MIFFFSVIFPRLLKEHDARKVGIHVKHAKIITFVEDKLTIAAKRTCKVQQCMIHVKHAKIITFVEDKLTIAAERTCKVHRTKQNRLSRTYLHFLTSDLFSRQLYVWLDNSRTVTFI